MKIAVFVTGWEKEYLQYIYNGFQLSQQEFQDEICIYTCFAQLSSDSRNKAEYDFFQLADLAEYDGILFAGATIREGAVRQKLIDWIVASGKPCVALEEEVSGMSSVAMDQEAAMKELVDHLVNVHGIGTFGFLCGVENSSEAYVRQNAVLQRVRELGLEMMPDWVLPGTYNIESGLEYGRKLLEAYGRGEEIPEGVLCANDVMAAGIVDALEGSPLEKTVAITGFDFSLDGMIYYPPITTIARPRESISHEGIRLLHQLAGQKTKKQLHRKLEHRLVVGQTCGCDVVDTFDMVSFRNNLLRRSYRVRAVTDKIDAMEERLAGKASMEETMQSLSDFFEKIGARSGKCYLTPDLFSEKPTTYRNCDKLELDWHAADYKAKPGCIKIILPLHYLQHRMGYCVIEGVKILFEAGMVEAFFRSICYVMENVIQRLQYQRVNRKLQRLYRIDQLTGIYNRFGMKDFGLEFFQKNRSEHRNTVFIFCDINRLKYINDTYGHEGGDWVIQKTGEALAHLESEESLSFRFGGDEFVLMTTETSGVDADAIRRKLGEVSEHSPVGGKIEVSIGTVIAPWNSTEDMEVFLNKADHAMYEEKRIFHEKYDRESKS